MKVEIERKFLLADESWRSAIVGSDHLRDGLISEFNGSKVRVRLAQDRATLTVKSPRINLRRTEFEYDIPRHEAEAMLSTVCDGRVVEKTRYHVAHEGITWSVDVYEKGLEGVVIAEIELDREDQSFPRPKWLGQEVSNDPRFHKRNLLRLALEDQSASIAALLSVPLGVLG